MLSQASRPALISAGLLVENSPLPTSSLAQSAAGRLVKLADWLADRALPITGKDETGNKSCFSTLRKSLKPPNTDDATSPLVVNSTTAAGASAASGGVAGRRARVLARVSGSTKRDSTTSDISNTGSSPELIDAASTPSDTSVTQKAAAVGQKRLRKGDCGIWEQVPEWTACALGTLPGQASAALTATSYGH